MAGRGNQQPGGLSADRCGVHPPEASCLTWFSDSEGGVMPVAGEEVDEQFEGCLPFFDVRGTVPRSLRVTVESTTLDGQTVTAVYERGPARLVNRPISYPAL